MAKLSMRGNKEMLDKRKKINQKLEQNVEKAGTWRDGKKVQFVTALEDLEMSDYVAAKKV